MGSAASAEKKYRLQHADRAELLKIWQEISTNAEEEDFSEEHRQLLLKALEVKDTQERVGTARGAIQGASEQERVAHVAEGPGLEEGERGAGDAPSGRGMTLATEVRGSGRLAPHASHETQDIRRSVENMLKSTLLEHDGVLPRESWIQFLQILGGTDRDAHGLLKDQKTHLSVDEFLKIINGPKAGNATPQVAKESKEDGKITVVGNLREYFQKHYRGGGEFCHPDYEQIFDADLNTWRHVPTGIQVWRDAIDLTSGDGGEVFFHYTSEVGFRNITEPSKKAAEVWASLNSDPGPKQNAWWGKGVYSVPLPPDQWRDRDQLLDNNFRNMMARDRAAPDKGPDYVESEYPKRVAFCVPLIIDAANAYDVSIRATPEMEAAGKEPGRNLGNKLLNAPGMPQRCCVVLRVSGEDGVKHAQGQLLLALRRRADTSADLSAKQRLGDVLMKRGFYDEALPILQELLAICQSKYHPKGENTLVSMGNLAILLRQMGRYQEALELQQQVLKATEAMKGTEHRETVDAMNNVANILMQMGKDTEAVELHRKVWKFKQKTLGAEDFETLQSQNNLADALLNLRQYDEAAKIFGHVAEILKRALGEQHPGTLVTMNNLGLTLDKMGKHHEAADLQRKVLEIREKTLGAQHPSTVNSMSNLGLALTNLGNCVEAENLHRRVIAVRERTLGAEHPHTLQSYSELAVTLHRMGELQEALELQRRAVSGMEKILGPDHPETKQCRQCLEELLQDLALKEAKLKDDQ